MSLLTSLALVPISEDGLLYELTVKAWESHLNRSWSLFSWYADLNLEGAGASILEVIPASFHDNDYFHAAERHDGSGINGLGFTGDPFASEDPDRFTVAVINLQLTSQPSAQDPLKIWITPTSQSLDTNGNFNLMTTAAYKGAGVTPSISGDRATDVGQPELLVNTRSSVSSSEMGNSDQRAEYSLSLDVNGQINAKLEQVDGNGGTPANTELIWESALISNNDWSDTGSRGTSYLPSQANEGKRLRLRAVYTDDDGFTNSIQSQPLLVPVDDDGQATYSITGDRSIGSTLTAARDIDDPDGNNDASRQLQWQRFSNTDLNGGSWQSITGANSLSYSITTEDEGQPLRLALTYDDAQGFKTPLLIEAGTIPFRDDGQAIYAISGRPVTGQRLDASLLAADPDGGSTDNTKLQWQRLVDGTWRDVGHNTSSFTAPENFAGEKLRVQSQYRDREGFQTTVNSDAITLESPSLSIGFSRDLFHYQPSSTLSIPIHWNSNIDVVDLTEVMLEVHFNSRLLRFDGVTTTNAIAAPNSVLSSDSSDRDANPNTDSVLRLNWPEVTSASRSSSGETLLKLNFISISNHEFDPITNTRVSTDLNLVSTPTPSYDLTEGFTNTSLQAQAFNLDVDGDGKVTALGDGLMIIRKLFGTAFAGEALASKAISSNATRSVAEIHEFIEKGVSAGFLDVDHDNRTTALGDGLMIIRKLFGTAFAGEALVSKAVSSESAYFAERNRAETIGGIIEALMPTTND